MPQASSYELIIRYLRLAACGLRLVTCSLQPVAYRTQEDTMADVKSELIKLIQHGLELEHAARIQYLAHAEIVDGLNAEPIIARLRELASDEQKHEERFRKLLGDYLGAVPSMAIAPTKSAKTIQEILKVNLKAEEEATVFYKELLDKIYAYKKDLKYEWETLEHEVRHIVIDEQEHIAELKILLGMR